MTYRERREARAARLREWADKREVKAQAQFARVDAITDMIPMGQPILVGHHSEGRARRDQGRIENGIRSGVDHMRTAERMNQKADNIERAADHAIYSDDPDARERLIERIAGLEAERETIKAYNRTCKNGTGDLSILNERQREQIIGALRYMPSWASNGKFPLTNLSGNINRLKKRLESMN